MFRRFEKINNCKVKEKCGQNMYYDVNNMVAGYTVLAKIPVKGKCQAGNRAIHLFADVPGVPGVAVKASCK